MYIGIYVIVSQHFDSFVSALCLGDMPDRPPRKMSLAAIHNSFRILRITNQGVTDLDKSVKHFKHLEKLILTANCIKKVDSR